MEVRQTWLTTANAGGDKLPAFVNFRDQTVTPEIWRQPRYLEPLSSQTISQYRWEFEKAEFCCTLTGVKKIIEAFSKTKVEHSSPVPFNDVFSCAKFAFIPQCQCKLNLWCNRNSGFINTKPVFFLENPHCNGVITSVVVHKNIHSAGFLCLAFQTALVVTLKSPASPRTPCMMCTSGKWKFSRSQSLTVSTIAKAGLSIPIEARFFSV